MSATVQSLHWERASPILALALGIAVAAALCDSLWAAAAAALWWIAVVAVVRSDLESFTIPDTASLAIGALGLVYAAASGGMADGLWADAGARVLWSALNGAVAFCVFWAVGRLYRLSRGRDGLGFGDVKLAAASAVWLAPAEAAMALEIAALGALALLLWHRRRAMVRDTAVPFGAFLAPAAWLVFVCRADLRPWLEGTW